MKKFAMVLMAAVLVATTAVAGWVDINESVRVRDGEVRTGKLSSVNGSISVGQGATVEECSTVNGSISLGADGVADEVSTVNGQIDVERGAVVEGGVSTVNGSIAMESRTRAERVETVNGRIRLRGAEVESNVTTYNGSIFLEGGAIVRGDIIVEDSENGRRSKRDTLRIELDGGSVVEGSIRVKDADATVEVVLRDGSRVAGTIEGAKVVGR